MEETGLAAPAPHTLSHLHHFHLSVDYLSPCRLQLFLAFSHTSTSSRPSPLFCPAPRRPPAAFASPRRLSAPLASPLLAFLPQQGVQACDTPAVIDQEFGVKPISQTQACWDGDLQINFRVFLAVARGGPVLKAGAGWWGVSAKVAGVQRVGRTIKSPGTST